VHDAGPQLDRLHLLTRADCTTRNRRKATALARSYDEFQDRIAKLADEEELAAIRPALDGNQIMAELGLGPGPDVGAAWKYLKDLRLEEGPMDEAGARAALRAWWEARVASRGDNG
jgi:poly(A) polymerase